MVQGIGGKEGRSLTPTLKYTEEAMGELRVINYFLQ